MIRIRANDKCFTISKQNLEKCEYFASRLKTEWKKEETESELELDEDPRLFRHFLNCLRYDKYVIPNKYIENVHKMLDYYNVKYDVLNTIEEKEECIFKLTRCHIKYDSQYDSQNDKRSQLNRSFSFTGKLINISSEHILKGISITYNGKEILNTISSFCNGRIEQEDINQYNLPKFFKKYLKTLTGEFKIDITFNIDKISARFITQKIQYQSQVSCIYFEQV